MSENPRHTYEYQVFRERMRVRLPNVCHVCGEAIDLGLSGNDPRGWTLDHLKPWATHPELFYDPANCKSAHRQCNLYRGASGSTPQQKPKRKRTCPDCGGELKINVSRHWGPCPS
ncbi:HNH endonuclease [Nocardia flavorosea]|uniref:HNH nuclease domain-containing protein n=1 Tax=Nocardia flavorosea TaxID=53429 RepID=A0A846YFB7_9NOCA|nr:HNH endonuclease [Nocardia flavorosea]NKY57405.1 hypothetical protein [Nocardia flavorosea]